jgi:hypothetical protein
MSPPVAVFQLNVGESAFSTKSTKGTLFFIQPEFVSSFRLSLKFSSDNYLFTKAEMRYLLGEIEHVYPVVM